MLISSIVFSSTKTTDCGRVHVEDVLRRRGIYRRGLADDDVVGRSEGLRESDRDPVARDLRAAAVSALLEPARTVFSVPAVTRPGAGAARVDHGVHQREADDVVVHGRLHGDRIGAVGELKMDVL